MYDTKNKITLEYRKVSIHMQILDFILYTLCILIAMEVEAY